MNETALTIKAQKAQILTTWIALLSLVISAAISGFALMKSNQYENERQKRQIYAEQELKRIDLQFSQIGEKKKSVEVINRNLEQLKTILINFDKNLSWIEPENFSDHYLWNSMDGERSKMINCKDSLLNNIKSQGLEVNLLDDILQIDDQISLVDSTIMLIKILIPSYDTQLQQKGKSILTKSLKHNTKVLKLISEMKTKILSINIELNNRVDSLLKIESYKLVR